MKIAFKTTILTILVFTFAFSTLMAGPAVENPDPRNVRTTHVGEPFTRIGALEIGSGRNLTLLDSFVYSFWDPDTQAFGTSWYWCSWEDLKLLGAFYTPNAKLMTATIKITDASGVVEYQNTYYVQPVAGAIQWIDEPQDPDPDTHEFLPTLHAGMHKVVFKFKQGDRVIGQNYWISMFDASDPACGGAAVQAK